MELPPRIHLNLGAAEEIVNGFGALASFFCAVGADFYSFKRGSTASRMPSPRRL